MLRKSVVVFAILAAFSTAAGAVNWGYDLVEVDGGTKTSTNAYAGLNWEIGGGATPGIVLGVFNTRVKSNNHTEGASLALHFNLSDGFGAPKLKLDYLNGRRDIQGVAGLGWDFKKAAPFVGLGANGPFIRAGVDSSFDGSFVPFFGVHSQGEFKKSNKETQCVAVNSRGQFPDATCTELDG